MTGSWCWRSEVVIDCTACFAHEATCSATALQRKHFYPPHWREIWLGRTVSLMKIMQTNIVCCIARRQFPRRFSVHLPQYYSHRNQFERFRVFWELISRFEFDFRRRGNYFLNDSNFLVCSKFNRMCCGLFVPTQFHFECCRVCDDS